VNNDTTLVEDHSVRPLSVKPAIALATTICVARSVDTVVDVRASVIVASPTFASSLPPLALKVSLLVRSGPRPIRRGDRPFHRRPTSTASPSSTHRHHISCWHTTIVLAYRSRPDLRHDHDRDHHRQLEDIFAFVVAFCCRVTQYYFNFDLFAKKN
jgi:hypothetical protein